MFENFTPSTDTGLRPVLITQPAVDQRSEPRQRCYKAGQIILGDVGPVYDCIFTDLSWYGVRLRLNGFVPLPNKFKLALNIGNNRRAFYCKPIWSNGEEVGVIFDHDGYKADESQISHHRV